MVTPYQRRLLLSCALNVGMTRAKERLYLIADELPCPEIERARNLMD